MPDSPFTWDPRKAKQNLTKHHVSFEEAATVFYDEQGLEMEDPLLAVCHCVRGVGNVIRIISARRAVKAEQNQYRERLSR